MTYVFYFVMYSVYHNRKISSHPWSHVNFSNSYNYFFSWTSVQVLQRRVGKITVKTCSPKLHVLVAIIKGMQEVQLCHKKILQL